MVPRKAAKAAPITPQRSSGRARAAAPASVIKDPSKKRGRATKAAAGLVELEPTPKRRGRPAKAKVDEEAIPEPAVEQPKKRRGRPKAEPVEAAPAPKRRGGRPRKSEPVPKRRGRPSKTTVDLSRVVGPSRVSKRTSPQAKRTTKTAVAPAPAPRINPKVRSKLRNRTTPESKRPVGRPPKNVATPTPIKTVERKKKDARVAKPAAKPRKKRGVTTIDVPDKFAKAIQDYLHELIESDEAAALEPAVGVIPAEEAIPDVDVDVTIGGSEGEPTDERNTSEEDDGVSEAESQDAEEPIIVEEPMEDADRELIEAPEEDELEINAKIEDLEDTPAIVTEVIQDIEIEEVEDVDNAGAGELDIHREIIEVTEATRQDRPVPGSLLADQGKPTEESEIEDQRGPILAPIETPLAQMFTSTHYRYG
ncbi:hypothetical protein N0V90_008810 [Kalmusia sp. IMI 367209]|nr:hypothetical protein N0V90_008810 [Kalmusia sp. IMI 367209]